MNSSWVAWRSLIHFWRSNLAIALGVAAATAVLTGALIVGSSMRGSLKDLTLSRLAGVDEVLRAPGFYRRELVEEIRQTAAFADAYSLAVPAIEIPASVVQISSGSGGGAGETASVVGVNLFGVDSTFWQLDPQLDPIPELAGDAIVINRSLADALGLPAGEGPMTPAGDGLRLAVRIPIGERVAAESTMGTKETEFEFVDRLNLVYVLPNEGLGRYSMYPTQLVPRNAFIPLARMQEALGPEALKNKSTTDQINTILFRGRDRRLDQPPGESESKALAAAIKPTIEDFELRLKRVNLVHGEAGSEEKIFDYLSLTSDRMVIDPQAEQVARQAFPEARTVMTYLANRLERVERSGSAPGNAEPAAGEAVRPVPFSMVSAVDFGDGLRPLSAITGEPIGPLAEDEVVLNEWAADALEVEPGDSIELFYFEPETVDGQEVEASATFRVKDVAQLVEPDSQWRQVGRGGLVAPKFSRRPALVNDPDLTPEVPGLTDVASVRAWKLPFPTPGIESPDEHYWDYYRTTPKAFVSLKTGQRLWGSRFGEATGLRIEIPSEFGERLDEASTAAAVNWGRTKLQASLDQSPSRLGFELLPLKRDGLRASSGSTPFDGLFLGLSMFVIVSALLLVSILFQLSLQQRSVEMGVLAAVGLRRNQVGRIWLIEMLGVCSVGSIVGVVLGVGYAALMLLGLRTWWVGAITTPFISLHVDALSLVVGLLAGGLVGLLTIGWSIWGMRRRSVRQLITGQLDLPARRGTGRSRWGFWVTAGLLLLGVGLAIGAGFQVGEAQAGSFLSAGFCFLSAMLVGLWVRLRQPGGRTTVVNNMAAMSWQSARRNPLRSTLTIGLVAAASFLIVSISAFRVQPSERGTAGFDWILTVQQPLFVDLNQPDSQQQLLGGELTGGTRLLPFKLKSGEDASCNNPYQSTQPRVLGVSPKLVDYFDTPSDAQPSFGWAATAAETDEQQQNPWRLLLPGSSDEVVPVVIDKNTAWWSLKVYFVGSEFDVEFDTGQTVRFRVVGLSG